MIPSPFMEEFFTGKPIKVLVFMETSPFSGVYQQIVYTPEARKKILDAIQREMPHTIDGHFHVTTNDKIEIKLSNVQDAYTKEEIEKLEQDDDNAI